MHTKPAAHISRPIGTEGIPRTCQTLNSGSSKQREGDDTAIDYDAPREATGEEAGVPAEAAPVDKAAARGAAIDLDESDIADSFELPGADLSKEELLVQIVPVQADEFTCMSCFLVHHRSQLAREKDGQKYCTECED